jgi:hypothetical protein
VAIHHQPEKLDCPLYEGNERTGRHRSNGADQQLANESRDFSPATGQYSNSNPAASDTAEAGDAAAAKHRSSQPISNKTG